ncbi:MAG: archaeal proteasome endopeptidase complex subunit alpha [Candidatus Micrarchaeota archaeon]
MYSASPAAYDRAITVFSPDGRLFQVEYAREAVKQGTTALGLIYGTGVVLAVDKNIISPLLKGESLEKIFKIDDHVVAASSGLVADARRLIDHARINAQEERMIYGKPVDIEILTRNICDLKQAYTQFGGARPFGTALLITGIDETGKHLFETDPSGAFNEHYAAAIGSGKKEVLAFFEKEYKSDLSFDDAIKFALKALTKVGDKKIAKETIDVYYIDEKDKKCTKMDPQKLDKYIKQVGPSPKTGKEKE